MLNLYKEVQHMKEMFLPQAENDILFTVVGSPICLITTAVLAISAILLLLFFKRR